MSYLKMVGITLIVLMVTTGCQKKTEPSRKETLPRINESKVLAKVNDKIITTDEFKDRFANIPNVDYTKLKIEDKKRVLDDLIRVELLYQEAVNRGLERDKDVRQTLEEARRQILAGQLIKTEMDNIKVEPKEIEDFYNTYKADFKDPEKVRLRQIVVPAEEEAKSILVELLKGADFERMAKERSKAPNAREGGLTEFVQRGELFPALDNIAFSLESNAISGVIKGPDGYYIVKLDGKQETKQRTLTEVWDEIKQGLLVLKRNKALEDRIAGLRGKAQIELHEDRL